MVESATFSPSPLVRGTKSRANAQIDMDDDHGLFGVASLLLQIDSKSHSH